MSRLRNLEWRLRPLSLSFGPRLSTVFNQKSDTIKVLSLESSDCTKSGPLKRQKLTPLSWELFKKWNSLLTFVVCRLLKRSNVFLVKSYVALWKFEVVWNNRYLDPVTILDAESCMQTMCPWSNTEWNVTLFERIENQHPLYTLWHSHLRWLATPSNFPSFDLKSHRWTSPPKSPETILCVRKS